MKLLILGATGKTGQELVKQALEQGHTVTAFARHPEELKTKHERLRVVQGDMLDPATLDPAVRRQDAVLSALGVDVLRKHTIMSDGTRNIIAAMKRHRVKRFICITTLGLGDSKGQLGPIYNYFLIPFLLRNIFADKARQEQVIRESALDWTIVRPGALKNGKHTGNYRHGFANPDHTIKAKIRRADVADFMLKQLKDKTYLRKAVSVSY
jgi:putative NADH-flavin reductase